MFKSFVPIGLLVSSIFSSTALARAGACKPLPHDPEWPSQEAWRALNESVSGRLVAPEAAGAACHPDKDAYDKTMCNYVQENWSNFTWHASSPWSVSYNEDTCLPYPSQPCSNAGYPAYVVKAESAQDVQEAVKFANRTDVRLVVKATGHDFLGRSSGSGSLSIWTHRMRGVEIDRKDPRAIKYGGVAAVKLSPGMEWGDVYSEMAIQNLTVVGGADPRVGVGGLIAGGGHSPLSAYYGFPADHVLEMEVVTADGELRTINEDSDSDLFWAMRGGGGSTFGVILSITVNAFPQLPFVKYKTLLNTTANSDTFWSMAAYVHTQTPSIQEAGGMGYLYFFPNISYLGTKPTGLDGQLDLSLLFPNRTADEVDQFMETFIEDMRSSDWAVDPIRGGGIAEEFPSCMEQRAKTQGTQEDFGMPARLSSWLLGEDALVGNFDNLKTQLPKASRNGYPFETHLVSGPAVRDVQIPGGENAVLPAWRDTYIHIDTGRTWPSHNMEVKSEVVEHLRDVEMPALKSLAPEMGAYMNEADPTNPEWKNDYFGDAYPRLLDVKRKWDPQGVFWCVPCVGHDDGWEVIDGPEEEDPVEWGIGQVGGRLCRKEV